ncbi:hypothetical protein [Cedecea sp. NFIX57]|uniref:hypothetical protein n=1 Tax=Cedecea sp. NFIX57 TaxID=1566286 RepID=UPI000A0E203A|nr:hypothetical protein [Cedecea sp. NFIX57]SMG60813.1 hypothetical protein SAMN03159353_103934 [Cedecea sp. NFIX57]
MSVTIIIKVIHTEKGIVLAPEIQAPANGHCQHEMLFATATVAAAIDAAKDLNEKFSKLENKPGEKKHVH